MTTERKYDPDFPYILVNVNNEEHTRWANKKFATRYLESEWDGYGRVIDTTPKPKILEGAEFICWPDGNGRSVAVWENFNPNKPWDYCGLYYSEESLLKEIGDAEVTVLVRKEES